MSNLLYENHMLKNTNYYLLCTISQFEKTQLAKMNKIIQEYNEYISTNMNNKDIDEINHKLQITITNRETLEKQLMEVQEKHDILKTRITEMETEYNVLSNQLQDTEEKHTFIQKQLEETHSYYKSIETEYNVTIKERKLLHDSLEESIIENHTMIKKLDEKNRYNEELQSQIVNLMLELEKQKEILENRISELERSKTEFQTTLENNTRPIDSEIIEKLKIENAELQEANTKLQLELIEIIKR